MRPRREAGARRWAPGKPGTCDIFKENKDKGAACRDRECGGGHSCGRTGPRPHRRLRQRDSRAGRPRRRLAGLPKVDDAARLQGMPGTRRARPAGRSVQRRRHVPRGTGNGAKRCSRVRMGHARGRERRGPGANDAQAGVDLAMRPLRGAWSDARLERARKWLESAVAQGDKDATPLLSVRLAAAPDPQVRNPTRARAAGDLRSCARPQSARAPRGLPCRGSAAAASVRPAPARRPPWQGRPRTRARPSTRWRR